MTDAGLDTDTAKIEMKVSKSELITPLADLRYPSSDMAIRNLINTLEYKIEGHERGDRLMIDIAYSDCKHDLGILKKLMGS